MKNKILKLLFKISFLPYIILILISLYYAIFGYDVYTWILPTYVKTIYGIEAFINTITWNFLGLCIIPIIPIIALYQIIYILLFIIRKNKQK